MVKFFTVTGWWRAVADPAVFGNYNTPELVNINALVTFTPRIPVGSLLYSDAGSDPTGVALGPRYARIWAGRLANINIVDTPDVLLAANTADLNLMDSVGLTELIYDVTFEKVTFSGKPSVSATLPDGNPAPTITVSGAQILSPFAFAAPTDPDEIICLTDPGLKRLPWDKRPKAQAPVQ